MRLWPAMCKARLDYKARDFVAHKCSSTFAGQFYGNRIVGRCPIAPVNRRLADGFLRGPVFQQDLTRTTKPAKFKARFPAHQLRFALK